MESDYLKEYCVTDWRENLPKSISYQLIDWGYYPEEVALSVVLIIAKRNIRNTDRAAKDDILYQYYFANEPDVLKQSYNESILFIQKYEKYSDYCYCGSREL